MKMRTEQVPRVITAKYKETSFLPVEAVIEAFTRRLWQLSRLSEVLAVTRD